MEFYLIRHGQSVNNASPDALEPDPGLTNVGRNQASCVGEALKGKGIRRLYCSPMLRALQTAEIVGRMLSLPPHVCVGLHEWDGIWEASVGRYGATLPGLTRSQMREICPDVVLPNNVTDEGWLFSEWENVELMLWRAYRDAKVFIQQAEASHGESDERAAVVSHGGFLATMICAFFDLTPNDDPDHFAHRNGAISKIRKTREVTQLRYLHRISHLPEEMLTW
ncbi:MAG: histidine phosphatase family protein [Candidatus Poribacteria bacterium]|nr:histidine phosphatase family protein [Candidatus Poribacteria bacterium]MDE0506440.1 histidine phosphatase family protein [Candidatus Poribacteria bacterium]